MTQQQDVTVDAAAATAARSTPEELATGDETLRAALAFVDEFYEREEDEVVDAAAFSSVVIPPLAVPQPANDDAEELSAVMARMLPTRSESNAPVATTADVAITRTMPPKRKRNKRREELIYLRATAERLEEKKMALEHRIDSERGQEQMETQESRTQRHPPKHGEAQSLSVLAAHSLASAWEGIAVNQLAQRTRAECENARLRELLDEQLRVVRALEALLNKRSVTTMLHSHLHVQKRIRISSLGSPIDSPTLVADLISHLGDMYEQTEAIFADPRFLLTRKLPHRVVQLQHDATTGTSVEVAETRVLPFTFQFTVDAHWQSFKDMSGHNKYNFVQVDITDDTIVKTIEGAVDLPRSTARARAKIVCRRFVKPNQVVMVWCMIVDPEVVAGTCMDGVQVRHRGWQMLRPIYLDASNTQQPSRQRRHHATSSQYFQVATPEAYGDGPGYEQKIGALTNFVVNTIQFHLEFRHQHLENVLLSGNRAKVAASHK